MTASVTDLGDGWKVGSEDLLAAVLQATAQPIWVVDPEGLIRFANPAAVAVLGYERADELVGRPSHATIHHHRPDGRPYPASECPMLLPRTSGETVSRELDWFFRRDGSMFPVSYVSVPLEMPEGRGAVVAFTDVERRLDAERRLREREARLAEQEAALRRIAGLVAAATAPDEIFAAVAHEVGAVLGVPLVQLSRYEEDGTATVLAAWSERPHPFRVGTRWPLDGPSISARVRQTGRPARLDDITSLEGTIAGAVRDAGLRSVAGAPIVVEGRVWGVMATGSETEQRLPDDVEERLAEFTDLLATALASTQARQDAQQLAEEQSALRRVATMVANGAPPEEVFGLVAREIARVTGLGLIVMARFNPDRTMTSIGAAGEHPYQPGTVWPLDGGNVSSRVLDTGRPVTIDPYAEMSGTIAEAAHRAGIHAGVGAPIIVDGQVWGTVSAGGTDRAPLPRDIERRLTQFTELVATAVSNAQARADLRRLADEQGALRRIATLVAQGREPQEVFDAVCAETGRLFAATTVNLAHFTRDGFNATIAGWSVRHVHVPSGTRLPLEGGTINALVRRTAAPGRFDSYDDATGELADLLRRLGIRSEVGAPVVVDGEVWGALIAGTDEPEPLSAGTEHRLAGFAELIATAVSNASARTELIASRARIVTAADEQRRRVVRDLHDGAQQRLIHAVMTLQLAGGRPDAPPELASMLGEALEDARGAIDDLRELARGIHPAILTHRGLAAAVAALTDRAPVPVRVDIPDVRLPAAVESTAYFVTAEALTNVAKYGSASTARVVVEIHGDAMRLAIEDDGVGGATLGPGGGLAGLVDRVTAVGGTLALESPAGAGTRVLAQIPLAPGRAD